MRRISILVQCSVAFFLIACVPDAAYTASIAVRRSYDGDNAAGIKHDIIRSRQANDEDSYEDSNEDDSDDEAEQAQQSLIAQQNQQHYEESQERSDEENGEDDVDDARRRRRRRQADESEQIQTEVKDKEEQPMNLTISQEIKGNQTTAHNRTSVLILIRDVLKKVTTGLPTEQVATSALQYFQLFEHFLQQAIERVIEEYDDDEEESTTLKNDIAESTEIPSDTESTIQLNKTDVDATTKQLDPVIPSSVPNESAMGTLSTNKPEEVSSVVATPSSNNALVTEHNTDIL